LATQKNKEKRGPPPEGCCSTVRRRNLGRETRSGKSVPSILHAKPGGTKNGDLVRRKGKKAINVNELQEKGDEKLPNRVKNTGRRQASLKGGGGGVGKTWKRSHLLRGGENLGAGLKKRERKIQKEEVKLRGLTSSTIGKMIRIKQR